MTKWTEFSTWVRVGSGARTLSVMALALGAALASSSTAHASLAGDPSSLFTSPGSGGSSATGGAVVAVVELEAPKDTPFVLRATIPVPPGTFPRKDGLLPLALRNADGFVVPTQMQVVSSYASERDGADVVEVLGRVDRPAGSAAGQRVSYQVVQYVHPNGPLPLDPYLVDFLLQPGHAFLVATDVFGHRYQVDLLRPIGSPANQPRVKVLRAGEAAVEFRTYNVMRPVGQAPLGPPDGPLAHFLGAHAYVTAWAETRALTLDLRLHNGFDGHDKLEREDDPLGKIYFRDLELWLPSDWTVVPEVQDVQAGAIYEAGGWTRYPIIKPMSSGKVHVFPHQSQLERRLSIARKVDVSAARSLVQDEGLAFCQRGPSPSGGQLWSWWNAKTARNFPQRHRLPDLSFLNYKTLENQLANMYWMAHQALESGNPGNYAVPSAALGWAHPWGIPYGGMTGGIEVNLYEGVQLAEVATHEGWLSMRLTHRMNLDRQRNALYGIEGDPTRLEKWIQYSSFPYVNMNFWMTLINGPDPFGFNSVPKYQVDYVKQMGLQPGYEDPLLDYEPHDFQHHVRFTRTPKVLAWLGNDALAKDDLRHAAEIVRMSMHDYPNAEGKYHTGATLFALHASVANHPNNGISWGRGESWCLDAVVAAYSLSDDAFRARVLPWLRDCADIVAKGQVTCSGFIQASDMPQWLGGIYRTRAQPEHTITEHALWGLTESVFRGADVGRTKQCE